MRIIVVGGGVLGTMHAWTAVEAGHQVVHIEREPEGRGASVRNFGLVWVSGRGPGVDFETALRGRELWQAIGERVPGVGFRGTGSLTVCRTPAEVAVAQAALTDTRRGFSLLEPAEARKVNPALAGEFMAALHCEHDAAVESRVALPALRDAMASTGRYRFVPGREVREVFAGSARDDHGETHTGDHVVVTPGAAHAGLLRELAGPTPPIRRVRLQMMQTAPLPVRLATAVADGDSFRYYPGFASEALDRLTTVQHQTPTAAAAKLQLLMVQRLDGGLTIGDTHEYDEPFGFDVTEDAYEHLRDVAGALLGRELPPIRRRWAGVYSQCLDPEAVVFRARPQPGVHLVTGPGGRGMTCAPAIAQDTAGELNWLAELVLEPDPVGAVVIDGDTTGARDPFQVTGSAAGHDEEVLVGPVGTGRRRRVDEVEGAVAAVQAALEGLHRDVGAHTGGLVEGGGEHRRRPAPDPAAEGLAHGGDVHRRRRDDVGARHRRGGEVVDGEGSRSAHGRIVDHGTDTPHRSSGRQRRQITAPARP